jgi:hypothetical protein
MLLYLRWVVSRYDNVGDPRKLEQVFHSIHKKRFSLQYMCVFKNGETNNHNFKKLTRIFIYCFGIAPPSLSPLPAAGKIAPTLQLTWQKDANFKISAALE